ncbi:hypothetical protein ISS21_01700 [Patescibacteria group bacterium]|nr:hypothetical protein [Patescibacteria group bacterium]
MLNKAQQENIELYKQHKEKIQKGDWKWYGLLDRFKCVKCGETLSANNSIISFVEKKGKEACLKLTCYICYSGK